MLDVRAALPWAVLMAFLSLLPAVGAALVWGPIALYLAADGRLGAAAGLVAWGVLVIGLVDNLLRPLLVGRRHAHARLGGADGDAGRHATASSSGR